MCEYLNESENFDTMWEILHKNKPFFNILPSIGWNSDKFGIEMDIMEKIKDLNDLDKYYGENYLDQFDKEDIEDYGYEWNEYIYNGFKSILNYWKDNNDYMLTDMNHRFQAVKQLGKKKVYVEINK